MTNKLGNLKKIRKRRPWPEKRRRKQAEINRTTRPWDHATGPKTSEGKAVTSQNAYKHGFRSRDMDEIRHFLRQQREFIKSLLLNIHQDKN